MVKTTKPSPKIHSKKAVANQFPHISGIIPAVLKNPYAPWVMSLLLALLLIVQLVILRQTWDKFMGVKLEEAKYYQELSYWQDVTTRFTNYRDGYLRMGELYYRLGNSDKAKKAIERSLEIDPRFEKAQEFLTFLTQE